MIEKLYLNGCNGWKHGIADNKHFTLIFIENILSPLSSVHGPLSIIWKWKTISMYFGYNVTRCDDNVTMRAADRRKKNCKAMLLGMVNFKFMQHFEIKWI